MAQPLFGLETEYACARVMLDPHRPGVRDVADQLVERARSTMTHLPDLRSPGVFLGNGARLYVDCGNHPEYATPECDNPSDLVRHLVAGDEIMGRLAAQLQADTSDDSEIAVYKGNVDLSGRSSTWGCHESYLHTAPQADLATQIIPHLVSRVVYTGSGGFEPLAPGLEFTLSPRARHLTHESSPDSTANRGIFHTKQEPLGRGHHRLHVLCGESLCSHLATWLKVGTTALVVALVDHGMRPVEELSLRMPLRALRLFARDPTCSARARTVAGRSVGAVDLQRHYLHQVETHLGHPFMPPWATDVCREWRAVLDALESDAPASMSRTLDWAIKWRVYDERLRRHGLGWDAIARWRPVVTRLTQALSRQESRRPTTLETLVGETSPVADEVRHEEREARRAGLEWSELLELARLRRVFFEIEARFSQVGTRGVFSALDRAGVLAHGVSGIDGAGDALVAPPGQGRARSRGEAIQRLSGRAGWTADWSGIWDQQAGRLALDLSDPLRHVDTARLDDPMDPPPADAPPVRSPGARSARRPRADLAALLARLRSRR